MKMKMEKVNNNWYKAQMLCFVAENFNLNSFCELGEIEEQRFLNKNDFEICILTNEHIEHCFTFDYHCVLKKYKIHGDHSLLTKSSMLIASRVIEKAKSIAGEWGWQ